MNEPFLSSLSQQPVVSVCMITYNHAAYISQAIESVLSQKTRFTIELVIGEDGSPDDTRKICLDYQKKYPDAIRLFLPDENQGMMKNLMHCLQLCKGRYIAFCEGDDYWIDPFKLQKQIDFLEQHPDHSLCYHDALIVYERKAAPPSYFSSLQGDQTVGEEDLLSRWMIPSASMVFRREVVADLRPWMEQIAHGDLLIHLLSMDKGRIRYIDQMMSVYRVSLEGTSMTARFRQKQDYLLKKIEFLFSHFDEYTDFRHTKALKKAFERRRFVNKFGKRYKEIGKWAYLLYPLYSYKKIVEKIRK